MLNVTWIKCGNDGHWCNLETLDLSGASEAGVYIIWHGGNPGRVVRVGQGNPVSARLSAHRNDSAILAYKQNGLFVTWAVVSADQRDGVERYLANTWNPLVGDAFPQASPIAVNSPWS